MAGLARRSDDELMTLAQARLRDAFEVLVERHAVRVVRTCARFVNDANAGAEIAQETWIKRPPDLVRSRDRQQP